MSSSKHTSTAPTEPDAHSIDAPPIHTDKTDLDDRSQAEKPNSSATGLSSLLDSLRAQAKHEQLELPLAIVNGETVTAPPHDLYIPPAAMEVFLDTFEGPLDLLLYLIRKQNLDILNINVLDITLQYMTYIELMQSLQLELAAEYLVMAAMLAEIKSRMLLPRPQNLNEEEEDPRAELIRRLQEYEQFKQAAETLDTLPRQGRDFFTAGENKPDIPFTIVHPNVEITELLYAFLSVMNRQEMYEEHDIQKEQLSTRQRMSDILTHLHGKAFVPFSSLLSASEDRLGVLVTFLAILELSKESLIDLIQHENFAPIHIKARIDECPTLP